MAVRIGAQRPRLSSLPSDISNTDAGDEVIEFAKRFGMVLDDWQQWCVRYICAERADGTWAATQSVLLVPRQAGKSALLEAIELAALFLWDEQHIIYSAHLQKTATDHMRRIRRHIEATPDLKRMARVLTGKGDERVERTDTGAILEFITRGKKSSRGGSPNRVIFDEAMFLQDDEIQAMLPAMSAQSMNEDAAAQMIYTSSAPIAESAVLHRLRNRAINERPKRTFFAEWSVDAECDPADRDNWYQANPGLGVRISEEWIEDNEFGTLSDEAFKTERLGVPVDPPGTASTVITDQVWNGLAEAGSQIASHRAWALSVSPDQKWATVGVAGRRADGLLHVEWMERHAGTGWIIDKVAELYSKSRLALRVHSSGPERSFISSLRERGVEVDEVSSADVAAATGQFISAANSGGLRHLGQASLDLALKGAVLRMTPDGLSLWSQRNSSVEITALMACTVAAGGVPAEVSKPVFWA